MCEEAALTREGERLPELISHRECQAEYVVTAGSCPTGHIPSSLDPHHDFKSDGKAALFRRRSIGGRDEGEDFRSRLASSFLSERREPRDGDERASRPPQPQQQQQQQSRRKRDGRESR